MSEMVNPSQLVSSHMIIIVIWTSKINTGAYKSVERSERINWAAPTTAPSWEKWLMVTEQQTGRCNQTCSS